MARSSRRADLGMLEPNSEMCHGMWVVALHLLWAFKRLNDYCIAFSLLRVFEKGLECTTQSKGIK